MSEEIHVDQTLDAKGLNCPLPILKTRKAINDLAQGNVLKVLTTDPGSQKDMPAWARRTANQIVKMEVVENTFIFYIKKLAAGT
jgi:tRNA 2-thiouridine synthesizing protein A